MKRPRLYFLTNISLRLVVSRMRIEDRTRSKLIPFDINLRDNTHSSHISMLSSKPPTSMNVEICRKYGLETPISPESRSHSNARHLPQNDFLGASLRSVIIAFEPFSKASSIHSSNRLGLSSMSISIYSMYSPVDCCAKKFLASDLVRASLNTRTNGNFETICSSSGREPSDSRINTSKPRNVWADMDRKQISRNRGSASGANGNVTETMGLRFGSAIFTGRILACRQTPRNGAHLNAGLVKNVEAYSYA